MSMTSHVSQIWGNVKWIYLLLLIAVLAAAHLLFFDYGDLQSVVDAAGSGSSSLITLVTGDGRKDDSKIAGDTPIPLSELETSVPSFTLTGQHELLPEGEEYIAACMAVKNQGADLPEFFIHHYYNIGIRHFYIYDDGSEPPLSERPDYGIPNSAITFTYVDLAKEGVQDRQPHYYNNCAAQYGGNHTWLAFFDADEFVGMTADKSLEDILREMEKDETVGALGITWITHDSNGLLSRPKSVRKSFTSCISNYDNKGEVTDNRHIKSIVKASVYGSFGTPHNFNLKDGTQTVGEHKDVVPGPYRNVMTTDFVALHHYAVKSKQEYQEKIDRSNAQGAPKDWGWWDHIEIDMPHLPCKEMAKYNP